jgi:hypothetical protein
VTTRTPPFIADLDYAIPLAANPAIERALLTIGGMDADSASASPALARFMIRSESVASSKIERVEASTDDYVRALAGSKANASATSSGRRDGERGDGEPDQVAASGVGGACERAPRLVCRGHPSHPVR